MRIDVLQHVPFEAAAAVADWAKARDHRLTSWAVYEGDLPNLADVEFLVVMGGPMNIYQESEYPWLAREKTAIKAAIARGAVVLGICLGAQLVADALGGNVVRNEEMEIGWFPVELTTEGRHLRLVEDLPLRFVALHWHGDTFSIPPGAVHVAASAACRNQAFAYDEGRVVGLQFHLEETPESLRGLIEHARGELAPGKWIQPEPALLAPDAPFAEANDHLFLLLDRMAERIGTQPK